MIFFFHTYIFLTFSYMKNIRRCWEARDRSEVWIQNRFEAKNGTLHFWIIHNAAQSRGAVEPGSVCPKDYRQYQRGKILHSEWRSDKCFPISFSNYPSWIRDETKFNHKSHWFELEWIKFNWCESQKLQWTVVWIFRARAYLLWSEVLAHCHTPDIISCFFLLYSLDLQRIVD